MDIKQGPEPKFPKGVSKHDSPQHLPKVHMKATPVQHVFEVKL